MISTLRRFALVLGTVGVAALMSGCYGTVSTAPARPYGGGPGYYGRHRHYRGGYYQRPGAAVIVRPAPAPRGSENGQSPPRCLDSRA